MKRSFSSWRAVPTSPEGRYRLATVRPGMSISAYLPELSNSSDPNPTAVRSGAVRDRTATPARPLAAAGAHTACQPGSSRSSAGSWSCSDRTS